MRVVGDKTVDRVNEDESDKDDNDEDGGNGSKEPVDSTFRYCREGERPLGRKASHSQKLLPA